MDPLDNQNNLILCVFLSTGKLQPPGILAMAPQVQGDKVVLVVIIRGEEEEGEVI